MFHLNFHRVGTKIRLISLPRSQPQLRYRSHLFGQWQTASFRIIRLHDLYLRFPLGNTTLVNSFQPSQLCPLPDSCSHPAYSPAWGTVRNREGTHTVQAVKTKVLIDVWSTLLCHKPKPQLLLQRKLMLYHPDSWCSCSSTGSLITSCFPPTYTENKSIHKRRNMFGVVFLNT